MRDVDRLAEHIAGEIRSIQPRGPYLLAGYCFWGIIAHEIARRLAAGGCAVDRLILVQTAPPGALPLRVRVLRRPIMTAIDPPSLAGFVIRRLRGPGVASDRPPALLNRDDGDDQRLFGLFGEALEHYRPRPYDGPITLIYGRATPERFFSRSAWSRYARGGADLRVIPGGHDIEMLRGDELARLVRDILPEGRP